LITLSAQPEDVSTAVTVLGLGLADRRIRDWADGFLAPTQPPHRNSPAFPPLPSAPL